MDSKKVLSAILIAVFLAGMANVTAASSSSSYAPSTSHVNLNMYVMEGKNQVGFAVNPVIYINASQGQYTFTDTGNSLNVSLSYGSYLVTVMPTLSIIGGAHYLTNKTYYYLDVNSANQAVAINLKAVVLTYSTVNLKNLNGETTTLMFSTTEGYNFFTKTTNSSSFSAYLPNGTMFYANSYYNSEPSQGVTSQILTLESKNTVTIELGRSAVNYFGAVYSKSGSKINSFKIVEFNSTINHYTTVSFNSGLYYVSAQGGTEFMIAANGYKPVSITTSGTLTLIPSTSNVFKNYSLSKNLQTLSVVTHYNLNSGTAFPDMANSTVMSLSYQEALDNLSTGFVNDVENVAGHMPANTYYSFMANNSYYNLTNSHVDMKSLVYNKYSLSLYTFANYTNTKMSSKDYKNLVLKVYQKGTQYTPSTVNYVTYINYNNINVSVQSASSSVTYGNPFEIMPVSKSSMVTVSFGKVQNPYFVNSNAVVYYKGMVTTSSVINTTARNTLVVVPYNTIFSINMSKTLYNPIIGQYQYKSPVSFMWKNSTTSYNGYNYSLKLMKTTEFLLTGMDSSGFSNVTNVTFIVLKNTESPNVNFTYTFNGKVHKVMSSTANTGTVSITVPQNSQVTFDASLSSLNLTYNKEKYSVQLSYSWMFPNSTLKGATVNYQFTTPTINGVPKLGMLNVTSAGNTTRSVQIKAMVNDTTNPSAVVTIQNPSNKNITAIPAGSPVILTANYSTDKYYGKSKLSYNWTFMFANGTKIPANTANLTILKYDSSSSVWNRSAWVEVQFNLVAKIHISLKVTNPVLSGYDNISYTTTYSGPKLLVSGVHYSGTFSQGVTKEVQVNVTNHGKVSVTGLTIVVYDNGALLKSKSFTQTLAVNQTRTYDINISLANSGSQSLSFQASNSAQPNFVQKDGQLVKTVSVGVSSDRVLLVIVAIIVIILILALLYYRLTKGKFPGAARARQQSLPQSNQKKITDQKQVPKKDGNTKQ